MEANICRSLCLIFIALTFTNIVSSFNIDVDYAVIKQGKPGSFFGFAVAEHQITDPTTKKVEQW